VGKVGTRDITVRVADGKFNYRVGAIIIDSGELLMVKNSGASFYYTVGGRIQFGESAHEAVLREAFEETNIRLEIDMLAYVHENISTCAIARKALNAPIFSRCDKLRKKPEEV
jgi:8-oxo-dGTP pyrophosphatase MutT (NUDIX family)